MIWIDLLIGVAFGLPTAFTIGSYFDRAPNLPSVMLNHELLAPFVMAAAAGATLAFLTRFALSMKSPQLPGPYFRWAALSGFVVWFTIPAAFYTASLGPGLLYGGGGEMFGVSVLFGIITLSVIAIWGLAAGLTQGVVHVWRLEGPTWEGSRRSVARVCSVVLAVVYLPFLVLVAEALYQETHSGREDTRLHRVYSLVTEAEDHAKKGEHERAVASWKKARSIAYEIPAEVEHDGLMQTVAVTAADIGLDEDARQMAISLRYANTTLREISDIERKAGREEEARTSEAVLQRQMELSARANTGNAVVAGAVHRAGGHVRSHPLNAEGN